MNEFQHIVNIEASQYFDKFESPADILIGYPCLKDWCNFDLSIWPCGFRMSHRRLSYPHEHRFFYLLYKPWYEQFLVFQWISSVIVSNHHWKANCYHWIICDLRTRYTVAQIRSGATRGMYLVRCNRNTVLLWDQAIASLQNKATVKGKMILPIILQYC